MKVVSFNEQPQVHLYNPEVVIAPNNQVLICFDPSDVLVLTQSMKGISVDSTFPTFAFQTELPKSELIQAAFGDLVTSEQLATGLKLAIGALAEPANTKSSIVIYIASLSMFYDAVKHAICYVDILKWKDRFNLSGYIVLIAKYKKTTSPAGESFTIQITRRYQGVTTIRVLHLFYSNVLLCETSVKRSLLAFSQDIQIGRIPSM